MMRKTSKIASSCLAFTLVGSSLVSAEGDVYPTDVVDNTLEVEIATALEKGWFTGYEDNTFRPDQTITPGQIETVIGRAYPDGATRAEIASVLAWGTYCTELDNRINNTCVLPIPESTSSQTIDIVLIRNKDGRLSREFGERTIRLKDTIRFKTILESNTNPYAQLTIYRRDAQGEYYKTFDVSSSNNVHDFNPDKPGTYVITFANVRAGSIIVLFSDESIFTTLKDKPCPKWLPRDHEQALRAPPDFDWGIRDYDSDGIPCEST